jgi:ligand-binding sensor domain-containing protein
MNRNSLFLLTLLLPYSSFSQEYSYTHYDITEGLAGSTVYCITQDRDGFIWVGTETGVSRFDGTHFKNFTTADGLPDIEVLQIFGDSKGRVWMAPFRKSVCYYYKGRIHTQENDSLLRRIQLKGYVENFAEDAEGNVLIQEITALHLVSPDGMVKRYDSIGDRPIENSVGLCRSADGHFLVQVGSGIWTFSGDRFTFFRPFRMSHYSPIYIAMNKQWMVWRENPDSCAIESLASGQIRYQPFLRAGYKHVSYSISADSLIYFNEFTGATQYNVNTDRKDLFLPGIKVSRSFRDQDGNLWFTTLGHGIFRLISDQFRLVTPNAGKDLGASVSAIARLGHDIWFGNDHNIISKMSLSDHKTMSASIDTRDTKSLILYIGQERNNRALCISDLGTTFLTPDLHYIDGYSVAVKRVSVMNGHQLLLSAFWGAAVYNVNSSRITDTVWRERCTTTYYYDSAIYVGTMNGLYRVNTDKSVDYLGKTIPFLRKRISSIVASDDHTLWISSFDDAGIVGIRGDAVVATITKKQGLTSDICRTLLFQSHILWVGTDKGLNRVELDKPGYPVTRYTSNDGLGSDMINTIFADSTMIYVGTPAGLSYFDETKANTIEGCRLHLLSLISAGRNRMEDTAGLTLPYEKSDIRMEFTAVSYRSAGNIIYKYRLLGLDSGWKETKDTYLEYPALPSGKYQFELQAVNKFGISSQLLSFNFVVATPFWRTIWFYAIILLLFLSLVWLTVNLRIKSIRRRQEEKEQLQRRMSEMEHKALQSQMNPHFIFNCLNSIQQYIFDKDVFAANKYITDFARLIRATLYNSTKVFITLADEIDYLLAYLSLEKLRFKEKMDYSVEVDPDINARGLFIPPMLVQPYVENSMRHGLRYKTDGKGVIRLAIRLEAGRLVMIIEDNGIGRERAASYKTAEHIEYQSRGMMLTDERIRLFNAVYEQKIEAEVFDLRDDEGRATGTRVVLRFPLFDHKTQNETYDPNHSGRR